MLEKINQLIAGETSAELPSLARRSEMRVDAINSIDGNLPGESCPLCNNRGYVAFAQDEVINTRRCDCMDRREALRLISKSGLADSLNRCTFANYETPKPWQKSAKEMAQDFVTSPQGWLVVVGGVGSGKTHLCTAVCGELIRLGFATRYMQWRTDAPKLKATVNIREEYERAINPLKRVHCLYIDDFWKGSVSEADISLAFELLNERYNNRKLITIISSERSISEILSIDEAVGSRIYERSKTNLIEISKGNNWRLSQ